MMKIKVVEHRLEKMNTVQRKSLLYLVIDFMWKHGEWEEIKDVISDIRFKNEEMKTKLFDELGVS